MRSYITRIAVLVKLRPVAFAVSLLVACSESDRGTVEAAAGDTQIAASTAKPGSSLNVEMGSDAWRALPAAQRAQRIASLQASAGPEFGLREVKPGVLSASHTGMALQATFERGRVSVLPLAGQGEPGKPIELAVSAWGCTGAMREVASAAPVSSARQPGVSYAHGDFDEWYRVGPAGVEQGFVVRELPACARNGENLRLQLRFMDAEGSIAELEPGDTEALLSTPGHRAVRYGEAFARDAAGREHAVHITTGDALALEIEVANVTLPLEIDPLIWDAQQKSWRSSRGRDW
jgi:hypothetical protein